MNDCRTEIRNESADPSNELGKAFTIGMAIGFGKKYDEMDKIMEAIKALAPQLKIGHWIADVDKWGDVVTTVNGYRCDKCNAFNSDKDNYCPNCGAKMVEPQESEDKK